MKRCIRAWLLLMALALAFGVPAQAETKTIRLSFAGDCTLGGDEGWMNHSIGTFKVMQKEQDSYAYFLEKCQPIFASDDFTLVNLEVVLADTARGKREGRKWNFRGTTDYVRVLTEGSVEGVTLGNNHAQDFGAPGLKSTKETLTNAGVAYCVDQEVCFYEKDGVKIAFMGFWESSFHGKLKWIRQEIPRLKTQEGCAAVVVVYHGGNEYKQKHSKEQEKDLRAAIDAGADLVVGHHPHVIQGIEVYKNRNILYSMGDFCYGGNRKPRAMEYPTYVAGVEMQFDEKGYLAQQLTIHPFRISATAPRNNYQPYPVTGEEAQEVMKLIQNDTPFALNPYVEGRGAVQDVLRNGSR